MKILVYGTGAVGSVFGGFLHKAGEEVVMLGRPEHMDRISSNGLAITGIWGEHLVKGIKTYSSSYHLKEEHSTTFDLILLTVKSYDTVSALADIRNMATLSTFVLSLQNGLGNTDAIARAVGQDQTLGGRVIFGAEIPSPGSVKVTVSADDVVIGRTSSKTQPKFVEEIANIFSFSGIKTRTTEEIDKFIWGKVLYNCALNAMATLLNINYGQLLESGYTKDVMRRIVSEIYQIAEKKGVPLEQPTKEEYIKVLFNKLIPLTSSHRPSMLQDIEKNRKTEIDYLNGAILKMSKELQLPCPANQLLTELIKFKDRK